MWNRVFGLSPTQGSGNLVYMEKESINKTKEDTFTNKLFCYTIRYESLHIV